MAAIAHAMRVNVTNQTTASTSYIDATNADIASGNFTAGNKYLILVMAQGGNTGTGGNNRVRVVHGTTAFADSTDETWPNSATNRRHYFWWTVWTAVSGEDINVQYSTDAGSATLNFVILLAINLSDDVTENTDWFYAECSTNDALTTTFLDGATITFTPGTASHNWLVLTNAQVAITGTSHGRTRMGRSGEAASSLPEARMESSLDGAPKNMSLGRVFTLGASSNTFAEQAAESAVDTTRTHSRVLALKMNKFKNQVFAYTEADVSLSVTNYATLLQTLSITPDVSGDVWIGSYFGFDANNVSRRLEYRIQRDNVDEPAGQTTANYPFFVVDALDEAPILAQAIPSLTAATAYTLDLDASSDSTTGGPRQDRTGACGP
jgi:hypothetical protein